MKSSLALFALFLLCGTLPAQNPHAMVVTDVRFSGLNGVPQAVQADLASGFKGKTFTNKSWLDELEERTRIACRENGYFRARAVAKLEPWQQDVSHQQVAVAVAVNEGQQYRLKDIQVTGAKAFPADEVRNLFPVQPGEVFNTAKIREGLEAAHRLYGEKGYIDFTPVPDTKIDDNTQLIEVIVQVDEGPQYRLKYAVLGPESDATRNLSSYLQLRMGVPFNPAMLEQLYADNASLFRSREDFEARARIERDRTNHFVNLIINLNY